jgi:hypothetical protein
MLSIQTEQLLASLLIYIAEGELTIEKLRVSLCSDPVFTPDSIFQQLDGLKLGKVSSRDLQGFCDN